MKKLLFMLVCIFTLTSCSVNTGNADSHSINIIDSNDAKKEPASSSQDKNLSTNRWEKDVSSPGSEEETAGVPPEISERPKYELEQITEKRYENDGIFIEFYDLPGNDAETLVCHNRLYTVTNSNYYREVSGFLYSVPKGFLAESTEVTGEHTYEWIKVNQVNVMSFDELKECDYYVDLFETLIYKLAPDMEIDDYVQMILNRGCFVVYIQYSDKFTKEASLSPPQGDDGEHEEYYLLVPDENNQLRIFASTQYYILFNVYDEDNIPNVLTVDF